MNPDFYLCDICRAEVPTTHRFFVATGRSWDGQETSDEGQHLDLCGKCSIQALQELLAGDSRNSYEDGKILLKWAKERKKT